LRGARLKYGAEVRVLDLSPGGMRIETTDPLAAQARVVFELAGPDSRILVPSRVLRSGLEIADGVAVYHGACAFERPLTLADLADARGAVLHEGASPPASRAIETGFQKVVARYCDGRLLRGYTNDFSPGRAHLHLRSSATTGPAIFVPLSQLKALFFVREFAGDPTYVEAKQFTNGAAGRKIEVTFGDGEVLVGTTLNFRPDGAGFFVHPADPRSNNLRVYVTHTSIRYIRFI
jgi:hypothetical protein